jgi:hypothetical protein
VVSEGNRIGMQFYPALIPRFLGILGVSTLAGWAHRRFALPWIAARIPKPLLDFWFRIFTTVILSIAVLSLMGIVAGYYYTLRSRRQFTALSEGGLAVRSTLAGVAAFAAFGAVLIVVVG